MVNHWTDIELNAALRLHKDGLQFNEIADKLNRTPKAVKLKLAKLGLRQNIHEFYENVVCRTCQTSFRSLKTEHRIFCSQSCSATLTNTKKPRKKGKIYFCLNCGKECKAGTSKLNKYCGWGCQREYRFKTITLPKFEAGLISDRQTLRRILFKLRGYKCEKCGISEWNGKPLGFIADHKNGDASNNLPENLQLVCPNCDSQSPYYMGKNRGNGRKSRGIKRDY